jgi:PAS domain-containing protein
MLGRVTSLGGGVMTEPQIDYGAVFDSIPIPALLLTPGLVIADVNLTYLKVAGRNRDDLVGRNVFDAFPDNPSDHEATGVRNLAESLRRVLATGQTDTMPAQKYDVEVEGNHGHFERRYWCQVNAPVVGPEGQVVLIVHCAEDVTDRVRKFVAAQTGTARQWADA